MGTSQINNNNNNIRGIILEECKNIVNVKDISEVKRHLSKNDRDLFNQLLRRRFINDKDANGTGLNFPQFIIAQYNYLYDEMIANGEVYGAYYKIKDLWEMILKFAVLVFANGISSYISQQSQVLGQEIKYDDFGVNKKYSANIKLFFELLLRKLPALGDWEKMGKCIAEIKNIDDIPLHNEHKLLYKEFLDVMRVICDEYAHFPKPNEKGKGKSITNYRNANFGHGATNVDIQLVFEEFKHCLRKLNTILDNTSYSHKIEFFEINTNNSPECVIKFLDNSTTVEINIDTFIRFGNPEKNSVALMDAFCDDIEAVLMLDYLNGIKSINYKLYKDLLITRNIFAIKQVLGADIYDERIKGYDYDNSMLMIDSSNTFRNSTFIAALEDLLKGEEKGAFLIEASRGMGKSVFARTITDDANEKLKVRSKNDIKISSLKDGLVWAFGINSFFHSQEKNFIISLHDFMKSYVDEKYHSENYVKALSKIMEFSTMHDASREDKKNAWCNYYNALMETLLYSGFEKILIVIDGVDELNTSIMNPIEVGLLCSNEILPKGMYILLMGRTVKECNGMNQYERIVDGRKIVVDLDLVNNEEGNDPKRFPYYNNESDNYLKIYNDVISSYIESKIWDKSYASHTDKGSFYDKIFSICDRRFVYLDALRRIKNEYPEGFLDVLNELSVDAGSRLLENFIKHMDYVDATYKRNVINTLICAGYCKKGFTLKNIDLISFNNINPGVSFKAYSFVNEVSCFLKKTTLNGIQFYNLSNDIWKEEIRGHFFDSYRKELAEKLLKYVKSTFNENFKYNILDYDYRLSYLYVLFNISKLEEISIEKEILDIIIKYFVLINNNPNILHQEICLEVLFGIENIIKADKDHNEDALGCLLLCEANAYKWLGDYEKEFIKINEIFNLIEAGFKPNPAFIIDLCTTVCELCGRIKEESLILYELASDIISKTVDFLNGGNELEVDVGSSYKFNCLLSISNVYLQRGELNKAKAYLDNAFMLLCNSKIKDEIQGRVYLCFVHAQYYSYYRIVLLGEDRNAQKELYLKKAKQEIGYCIEILSTLDYDGFSSELLIFMQPIANIITLAGYFYITYNNDYSIANDCLSKAISIYKKLLEANSKKIIFFDEFVLCKALLVHTYILLLLNHNKYKPIIKEEFELASNIIQSNKSTSPLKDEITTLYDQFGSLFSNILKDETNYDSNLEFLLECLNLVNGRIMEFKNNEKAGDCLVEMAHTNIEIEKRLELLESAFYKYSSHIYIDGITINKLRPLAENCNYTIQQLRDKGIVDKDADDVCDEDKLTYTDLKLKILSIKNMFGVSGEIITTIFCYYDDIPDVVYSKYNIFAQYCVLLGEAIQKIDLTYIGLDLEYNDVFYDHMLNSLRFLCDYYTTKDHVLCLEYANKEIELYRLIVEQDKAENKFYYFEHLDIDSEKRLNDGSISMEIKNREHQLAKLLMFTWEKYFNTYGVNRGELYEEAVGILKGLIGKYSNSKYDALRSMIKTDLVFMIIDHALDISSRYFEVNNVQDSALNNVRTSTLVTAITKSKDFTMYGKLLCDLNNVLSKKGIDRKKNSIALLKIYCSKIMLESLLGKWEEVLDSLKRIINIDKSKIKNNQENYDNLIIAFYNLITHLTDRDINEESLKYLCPRVLEEKRRLNVRLKEVIDELGKTGVRTKSRLSCVLDNLKNYFGNSEYGKLNDEKEALIRKLEGIEITIQEILKDPDYNALYNDLLLHLKYREECLQKILPIVSAERVKVAGNELDNLTINVNGIKTRNNK